MNQRVGGSFRIPWWLIVGSLGFLVFGGWRGFFGAIFGVLFLPLALFIGLALIIFAWAYISGKRFTRFPGGIRPPQNNRPGQTIKPHNGSDIVETEATVIKRED